MARLGDIFTISSGGTPDTRQAKYYANGTIPWVKTGDLKEKYISNNIERITQEGLDNSSAKIFPAGTVLVAMYGATIGACSILNYEASTNQACAAFLPTPKVLPDYLYYFLNSKKQIFIQGGVGGAQPNISAGYLKKFPFDIRPLEEQTEIILVLDKLSNLISLRKQQLAKLDELVKARFVEMFGDPVSNPFKWERKRFDSICENLDSHRIPITASDRRHGPYPYYGASGIVDYVDNYIFDENILLISEDGANLLARVTPIAFSVSGKVWVNNHAHVVRFQCQYLQTFVEHYFSLIDISYCITGTAQPKLNQAKLNSMMIPIPDVCIQKRFAVFVNETARKKLTIQQSLDKLEVLKKSLMQEYFG